MKVGIICECQRKRLFFRRMKVKSFTHPKGFGIVAVELGVTAKRLCKIAERRPKKFVKIIRRAERIFISEYIKTVVIANSLKPVLNGFPFNCVSAARGGEQFYRFLPTVIRQYKEKCKLGNTASLGIRAYDADRRVEFLVDALYRDFKSIDLYIENSHSEEARILSEQVLDDTGLLIGVFDDEYAGETDVFADLKNNRLRVGQNTLINKIELDIDLLGFDISSDDLFAAAELKKYDVKSCLFC